MNNDVPTTRDERDDTLGATKPLSDAELTLDRATVGRYQIQRVLGRGGMGIVVAARDPELDRAVAVKIIVDHAKSPEALGAALRREAQALARVHHPNVVPVYDAGVDGSPFLVMQLVEGETLGAHLARVKPPPRAILELFLQAARGLTAIHAAGLIHRDFKPSNALVDRDGRVCVADLGLARIGELAQAADLGELDGDGEAHPLRTNTIAGTPAYMAPEQKAGLELTPACDQYSFCVALREALADGGTELPAGRLPKRGVRALQRGLAVDPAARWPSMSALVAELTTRSRVPWLVGGGVLAAAGIASAAVLATGSPRHAPVVPPPPAPTAPPVAAPPATPVLALTDARRLTVTDACDEYPSVAPDGTIYYDSNVGPDMHLMAIDPATHATRELTTTKGWDLAPQVSPDGTRLAFLRKTDVAMTAQVAALDDLAHPLALVFGGFRPSWSPDGTAVWAGGRKGIARYDAKTGAKGRSLELPAGAFPMAALELADGRVVVLTKTGSANADGLALYDAGATTSHWLLPGNEDNPMDEALARAPTGDAVLVGRYTVTSQLEIWNVPLDGSPPTVAGTGINARKHLVATGKRLVWSDCNEFGTIAAVTRSASGATVFTDLARNPWFDFSPVALPGTDELLFLTYRTQSDEIWRMKRDGTSPRAVPFGKLELDRITVSHDGTLLAGANDDGVFAGPLDGSKPPVKLAGADDGSEHNATFSRDGTQLIFERQDEGHERISTIPVGGGTPKWLLPPNTLAPAQSPTADVLAYLADVPGKGPLARVVMLLDQRTGKTRRLSAALPAYPYRDLRWSTDGTRLLAARRDGTFTELAGDTGAVLRTFEVGSDQLIGETYIGDELLVGRSTSAGDIWEADLR